MNFGILTDALAKAAKLVGLRQVRRGNRGSAANGPSSPFFVKAAMVNPRSHSSVSSSAALSTNHVRLLILIGLIEGIDS
jgi:hypothetical protein